MTEPEEPPPGSEDSRTEPRAEWTDPVGPHRATIVWLHGIGQEPAELAAVAARLHLAEAGIRGVYPYGPVRTSSPLTGAPVRVWYPQNVFALDKVDLPGLMAVRRRLSGLVAREAVRIGSERVLLAGFSQGAMVALALGLCHPRRLAGLALYAPFLPPEVEPVLTAGRAPAASGLPVWIGHGARDWIVPLSAGAALRDTLTEWGHPVSWQRYRGGHEAFAEVVASLPDFLNGVLGTDVPRGTRPSRAGQDR